ncbi:hypothetical protein C8R43DRAFT_1162045 [Mycena crocata]|nr:hypothetical protein C8R43DRAFT_1162045 [Mycena crocata]
MIAEVELGQIVERLGFVLTWDRLNIVEQIIIAVPIFSHRIATKHISVEGEGHIFRQYITLLLSTTEAPGTTVQQLSLTAGCCGAVEQHTTRRARLTKESTMISKSWRHIKFSNFPNPEPELRVQFGSVQVSARGAGIARVHPLMDSPSASRRAQQKQGAAVSTTKIRIPSRRVSGVKGGVTPSSVKGGRVTSIRDFFGLHSGTIGISAAISPGGVLVSSSDIDIVPRPGPRVGPSSAVSDSDTIIGFLGQASDSLNDLLSSRVAPLDLGESLFSYSRILSPIGGAGAVKIFKQSQDFLTQLGSLTAQMKLSCVAPETFEWDELRQVLKRLWLALQDCFESPPRED